MFLQINSLILKTTRSQYGSAFDARNDYVVIAGDHVIGRIFLSPQSPPGRQLDVDDHCCGPSGVRFTVAAIQRRVSKRWRISKRSG